MMYYVEEYPSGEIVTVETDLKKALEVCIKHEQCIITDENDNVYFDSTGFMERWLYLKRKKEWFTNTR